MPDAIKPSTAEDLIGVTDATRVLNVSVATVYRMHERGEIEGSLIAGRLVFSRRALERVHATREKRAAASAA